LGNKPRSQTRKRLGKIKRKGCSVMSAIYAGLLAWSIEVGVATIMLLLLIREEKRVIKKREKTKDD
jgi:hypothetical protein